MRRYYNPVKKCVEEDNSTVPPPKSLQHWCRKVVLASLGLNNIKAVDTLPLPTVLQKRVGSLSIMDFHIDPESIRGGEQELQQYQATYIHTNKQVVLKIMPLGIEASTLHPTCLTTFEQDGSLCCVHEPTQTLAAAIQQHKERGTSFNEDFVKFVILTLIRFFQGGTIPVTTHLSTEYIQLLPSNHIVVEIKPQHTQMNAFNPRSAAVYEAPEVLSRADPDSRALIWTLGCIIYEMVALKPAFYDKEGNNPFQVYMDIMQGRLPPEPEYNSICIKGIIYKCLKMNPEDRIELYDIKRDLHINAGDNFVRAIRELWPTDDPEL